MRHLPTLLALILGLFAPSALGQHGVWIEPGTWSFRRGIEVNPLDKIVGADDVGMVEFYTGGHAAAKGEDIRVATDEGRIVPSRVLMMGPGDRASVAFTLIRNVRKYNVFFGNADPPLPPPGTEDISFKCGLLLEMKIRSGVTNNAKEIEQSWEKSKTVIGQTMLESLFMGFNPFGDYPTTIARIRGTLACAIDGTYFFAVSAQDRGSLLIDGAPVVFASALVGDVRFSGKVPLKKGPHLITLYVAGDGEGRFSVVWKRPDSDKIEVIPRDSFGSMPRMIVGPLEEVRKAITADWQVVQEGECFYDNHYSYRYTFTAIKPKGITAPATFNWDFGDGQTASGETVRHVYLDDGTYPMKLTTRVGLSSDEQTNRFAASRDRRRLLAPPMDEPGVQSQIVALYDVGKLPPKHLPWAVMVHQRAQVHAPMLAAAIQLAKTPSGFDSNAAFRALHDATMEALKNESDASAALGLWDLIPASSVMKPAAVKFQASQLLWYAGEFARAVKVLEPYAAGNDRALHLLYGQALLLNQQVEEGRKVLNGLPIEGPIAREAAISGAMARTVDYFVEQKDWESGEEAWEKWQIRYPHDFLSGYSALQQCRLMEIRKTPIAAAKVAQAFADAVPRSSYAPQLLDRASKLLAESDPAKSKELRDKLKKRYPEDPLSQGEGMTR